MLSAPKLGAGRGPYEGRRKKKELSWIEGAQTAHLQTRTNEAWGGAYACAGEEQLNNQASLGWGLVDFVERHSEGAPGSSAGLGVRARPPARTDGTGGGSYEPGHGRSSSREGARPHPPSSKLLDQCCRYGINFAVARSRTGGSSFRTGPPSSREFSTGAPWTPVGTDKQPRSSPRRSPVRVGPAMIPAVSWHRSLGSHTTHHVVPNKALRRLL